MNCKRFDRWSGSARSANDMLGRLTAIVVILLAIALPQKLVFGIPPAAFTDRDLATKPVIVVAKADKTGIFGVRAKSGDVEKRATIIVERVVAGKVDVGKHIISVDIFVDWSMEDGRVEYTGSSEALGDGNANKSSLWFLSRQRSKDGFLLLSLDSYRAVQPLCLEPLYRSLREGTFDRRVKDLLASDHDLVAIRTLKMMCGGTLPWPYEPGDWELPVKLAKPVSGHADSLKRLIHSHRSLQVRRDAAAVYARLEGKKAVPELRSLLASADPDLRAIAVGWLIKYDDRESRDAMRKAVKGVDNCVMACEVIARVADMEDDVNAVPILIEFLETDGLAYQIGSDVGIPAIQAQEVIWRLLVDEPKAKHSETIEIDPFAPGANALIAKQRAKKPKDYVFPFDVIESRKAWKRVADVRDRRKRLKRLRDHLQHESRPWKAELVRERKRVFLVITNTSRKPLSIAKCPDDRTISYIGGVAGAGPLARIKENGFVRVAPGEKWRIEFTQLYLGERRDGELFVALPSSDDDISVLYTRYGRVEGTSGWLGELSVSLGSGWYGSPQKKCHIGMDGDS